MLRAASATTNTIHILVTLGWVLCKVDAWRHKLRSIKDWFWHTWRLVSHLWTTDLHRTSLLCRHDAHRNPSEQWHWWRVNRGRASSRWAGCRFPQRLPYVCESIAPKDVGSGPSGSVDTKLDVTLVLLGYYTQIVYDRLISPIDPCPTRFILVSKVSSHEPHQPSYGKYIQHTLINYKSSSPDEMFLVAVKLSMDH